MVSSAWHFIFALLPIPQLTRMIELLNRHFCRVAPLFFLFWVMVAGPVQAQAQTDPTKMPETTTPAAANSQMDVAKRIDPTDFKNRFDLRGEYVEYGTGSVQAIVPRFEYAFSKALGFRTELPLEQYELNAGPTRGGIGNLLTRLAWRALRTDDVALVVGSELILDTASSPKLGNGKHVLAPFAFAAFDLPQAKSVFFPYIQYGKAIGGDASREAVEYTNVRASLLTRWPAKAYSFVEYSYFIDHERANVVSSQIKAEAGRFILPKTSFYVRPGTGLSGTNQRLGMHWSLELGIRHFF